LCLKDCLLTIILEKTSEDVMMQNMLILKEIIKMKKNSMNKNLSDNKIDLIMQVKKLQIIIKKQANTEKLLKIMMNQKM